MTDTTEDPAPTSDSRPINPGCAFARAGGPACDLVYGDPSQRCAPCRTAAVGARRFRASSRTVPRESAAVVAKLKRR